MPNKYLNPKRYLRAFKSIIKNLLIEGLIPDRHPSFLIVGAQKSGTSSLYHNLKQHPRLLASRNKEIYYFSMDENFKKGQDWYLNKLKNPKTPFKSGLLFEATPVYLIHPHTAKRIYDFDPNIKIIVILREPIARAYSAWNMYGDFWRNPSRLPRIIDPKYNPNSALGKALYMAETYPSFEKVAASEMKKIKTNSQAKTVDFIRRGIYLPQIKRFHELFGKDRVLILGFKELVSQKKETLNKILGFLDLKESNWDFLEKLDDKKKNSRSYTKKIDPKTETELEEFYKPYNKALFEYLGREINW